mgnify:CR=1 FL=1
MNKDKFVFAQLIEFLDNNKFRHLVDKYDGNRYVKHITCWNQLLAMMFGQLSNRESLRDLFFKWLKQHLKIKKFWGTTENAARIQISSAIIAYCPVAIVQHDLQLKRSTYEALQILSISLMDKTPLVDFFERTDFNNVKELDCPLFPGLFD